VKVAAQRAGGPEAGSLKVILFQYIVGISALYSVRFN